MTTPSTETLQDLYRRFRRDETLTDREWMDVHTALEGIATRAVWQAVAKYALPAFTVECRIEDVRGVLMEKFIRGIFDPKTRKFEAILATTARRDVINVLRAIKSPMAMSVEQEEGSLLDGLLGEARSELEVPDTDTFGLIRGRLDPFRWPEHGLVRELLLSFLLQAKRYPGPEYIIPMVPAAKDRDPVYNAAVFDINHAILGVHRDVTRAA